MPRWFSIRSSVPLPAPPWAVRPGRPRQIEQLCRLFQKPLPARVFSPWRITSAYVYEGGWEKLYPIFPLRRPRPSRAGSPGTAAARKPGGGCPQQSHGAAGRLFSLFMERRADGRPERRLTPPFVSPLLGRPCPAPSRSAFPPPTGRTGQDQRHRQQEDGHPSHRSAGVHQGGPVLSSTRCLL